MAENTQPVTDGSLTFRAGPDGSVVQSSSAGEITFDPTVWRKWRKKTLTHAAWVGAPFTVETSEGPLRCEKGYLAVDARGYPYPIADDEFKLIYEPVE